MLIKLLNTKYFIPSEYKKTVYDIDFSKLYDKGIRLILTDLDNTLISYDQFLPNDKITTLYKELCEMGFEVVLVSNNKHKRVSLFADALGIKYISSAKKPLKSGLKKAIKLASKKYPKAQTILIGDQLMTDVYGGGRLGIYTIVVDAIKRKTEKWYTKLNRKLENRMMKRLKKKHYDIYKELNLREKK